MRFKSTFFKLVLFAALIIVSSACTRSASTPPPENEAAATIDPASIPIKTPTETADSQSDTTADYVFPDVTPADCSVEYLNDYSCLLQSALYWVKENDKIPLCEDGFCPDNPLTLVELHDSLSREESHSQKSKDAIDSVFPNQTFGLVVTRGSLAEVFRLVFYPDQNCEFQGYYTDMSEDDPHTCAAEILLDNGLYLVEDLVTDFDPADEITRGQFAVMLYLQLTEGRLQ